jgi:hypothetical protein
MSYHPRSWSNWLVGQPYTDEMLEEMAMCVTHNAQGHTFMPAAFAILSTGDDLCLAMANTLDRWCKDTGYKTNPDKTFSQWLDEALNEEEKQLMQFLIDVFEHMTMPDWDAQRIQHQARRPMNYDEAQTPKPRRKFPEL